MHKPSRIFKYFKLSDILIWSIGVVAIVVSFFVFRNTQYHYLVGSIIGITALVFVSEGNPVGQVLTVVFSVFYGIISYSFAYYGEMITYLGMSLPMAIVALVLWLKNPYKGKHSEVKVNTLSLREWLIFLAAAAAVTVAFYFILRALNTANLAVSTVSVLSSFVAAYLTARRSRFYGLFYALNDIVLIAMWIMASRDSLTYLPMVVCFVVFLALDIYGFINWSVMRKRQQFAPDIETDPASSSPEIGDGTPPETSDDALSNVPTDMPPDAMSGESFPDAPADRTRSD